MKHPSKIVFYDGDCGFCSSVVQLVLRKEKGKRIHFSALQSDFSLNFFKERKLPIPDMTTFYFFDKGNMYSKSSAAIRVGSYLKFPWTLVVVFYLVPSFIRDWVYDQVAKRRKTLQKEYCLLPDIKERKRFL